MRVSSPAVALLSTTKTAHLGAARPGFSVYTRPYITSERPWAVVYAPWSIGTPFMEMLVLGGDLISGLLVACLSNTTT